MVSLQIVRESNALLASLPKGLVALFIGATSGIGLGTLQHFAGNASSPHIYSVARAPSAASHEALLGSLRQSRPDGSYTLIRADASLVSEMDRVADFLKEKETHLDVLFLSAGFMAFEGRKDTAEGLDPSMSTRYYARVRAVQQLLPLLERAPSPRVVSVLAGGLEGPLNEQDLDLRDPANWSFWNASVHAGTMGTLALERLARDHPRLSIVHWFPGPVDTPGLARARGFGMSPPNPMSQDEAGARGVFLATSDRYAVPGVGAGLVPAPKGSAPVKRSGGGIFLVNPQGEGSDNERTLSNLRRKGIDKAVWDFTQDVFAKCAARGGVKDEL